MEYYKNLTLEDLFYINDNGLICCEEWKDVPDYVGFYKASNLGRIKSLSRTIFLNGIYPFQSKEKILKQGLSKFYLNVVLSKEGIKKSRNVHTLIAEVFLNHTPCGFKLVVDHINTDNPNNKTDNRVDNLRIVTARENSNKKHLKSTSKYIGVNWNNNSKKWVASIFTNGKQKHLGRFTIEEEANEYYQNALSAIKNNEEIVIKNPNYSSKYKGVFWHKVNKKWTAQIYINSKGKKLGSFSTELEAHNAYENALKTKKERL